MFTGEISRLSGGKSGGNVSDIKLDQRAAKLAAHNTTSATLYRPSEPLITVDFFAAKRAAVDTNALKKIVFNNEKEPLLARYKFMQRSFTTCPD
jgi:hypothetical protein